MSALICQKKFSQEGAEKQAQLERSLREKAAVEKELEKVSFTPQGTYLSCSQWYFAFVELGKHASERASAKVTSHEETSSRRVFLWEMNFARACMLTHPSNPKESHGLLAVKSGITV